MLIPQPIKPFNRKLSIFPAVAYAEPREGRYILPLELDWDGAGSTFDVNVAAITTQPFSQIGMLDVDNSASGADVQFIFPDTGDTLTVPAYSAGTFPVFTGGRLFYVSAPAALVSDITRVRVLNFRQEPISNPTPQFHNVAASGSINPVNGTTPLLAPAVNGTLVGYSIDAGLVAGAAQGTLGVQLKDHTAGTIIDQSGIVLPTNQALNGLIANVTGIAYRFAGGIDITLTAGGTAFASGGIFANLKYRAP